MSAFYKIDGLKLGEAMYESSRKNGFSDTQATIVQQLYSLNPAFNLEFRVRAVINLNNTKCAHGEYTAVRIHCKGRRTVNIDIAYNEGSDLYDVKAYEIQKLPGLRKIGDINEFLKNWEPTKEIFSLEGAYFEDLNGIIRGILAN